MATAINKTPVKTVDDYIKTYPAAIQTRMQKIRKIIKSVAPKADEMISYGIAGYKYKGMLIYFAGFKNHVSVYPAPRTVEPFKKELAGYGGGKGTVQFPNDEPIPFDLVKRIVQFRLKANEEKAAFDKPAKPTTSSARTKTNKSTFAKASADKQKKATKNNVENSNDKRSYSKAVH